MTARGLFPVTGHAEMTWDEWYALARLSDEEFSARAVACCRCKALRNQPCLASTGLPASRPCAVRAADAAAEAAMAA